MPVVTQHQPGMFCWADLQTTDQDGARRFYTQLFGWTTHEMPVGGGQTYTMLLKDGRQVAALSAQDEETRRAGQPPFWANYVAVTSADETAKKAESLGGRIVMPPMDVFDSGRMAVLRDPTGAFISLWQPRKHPGAGVYGDPDTLVWAELLTNDTAKAEAFYTRLFGWTPEPMDVPGGRYTVFRLGGSPAGGMMTLPPELKAPPHWLVYFAVADAQRTLARLRQLGGRVHEELMHVEGVGRFAPVADPQGASFSILQPEPRSP